VEIRRIMVEGQLGKNLAKSHLNNSNKNLGVVVHFYNPAMLKNLGSRITVQASPRQKKSKN
jgi:hypothetical protein